jgi:hypothetical protein
VAAPGGDTELVYLVGWFFWFVLLVKQEERDGLLLMWFRTTNKMGGEFFLAALSAAFCQRNRDAGAATGTSSGRSHRVPWASDQALVPIHKIGEQDDHQRYRIG